MLRLSKWKSESHSSEMQLDEKSMKEEQVSTRSLWELGEEAEGQRQVRILLRKFSKMRPCPNPSHPFV